MSGIATVWLDRPERGNALSSDMVEKLARDVAAAAQDDGIHTLVLRGRGAHFCTGFDLSALDSETDASLAARFEAVEAMLQAVWHFPKRTVALATGRTWGAGADLFASCDVRAATKDATFRFPGSAFGIVLGTRRLAELLGWDRARPLVTEGRSLDLERALACGLCTHEVTGDAEAWIAALPAPVADATTLALMRRATRADHRQADMAALLESARRPGVAARIAAYREKVRAAKPA